MTDVTLQRWHKAQAAEDLYWQFAANDPLEFLRITREKIEAIQWAEQIISPIFNTEGIWVEIGIGPLGVGCIHFVPGRTQFDQKLVGIDPLPYVPAQKEFMPLPIRALLDACHSQHYRHMTGTGENIQLEPESAAFVVCYNVLDHCRNPIQVIQEVERILKPGGFFLLGCDAYSWAGLIKHRLRSKTAKILGIELVEIGDIAHPHQFLVGQLEKYLTQADLDIQTINSRRYEQIQRVWSHAHRVLVVARKLKGGIK